MQNKEITAFPTVKEIDTILKIENTQHRIKIMVRIKDEIKKNIRPLLMHTDDESANARYNELYAQIDTVIAKDAKFLVEISEQKPLKI